MESIDGLFPAGGILDEERQIGRGNFITELAGLLERRRHVMLLGDRQIGKSSVIRASGQRRERAGQPVAFTDLSSYQNTPESFTRTAITELGASAGRVVERAGDGARVLAAALADLARLRSLAEKIAKGAEEEPASALLELATALERHGQHAVLAVDEAHIIGGWGEAGVRILGALREIAHRESRPLTLVLASSETSALQRLSDSPLVWALESPHVPAIEFDQWRPALRERFSRAGRPIDDDALEALLMTFQGHPFKTMWVAREAASLAQREHADATAADHVEAASRAARDQRWAAL